MVASGAEPADRDRTLLRFAKQERDAELRERAILGLSSFGDDAELAELNSMLALEPDPVMRYAIRHAVGSIERAQGLLERGLTALLSSSGLAQPGSAGIVSFEVKNEASDGFARINIDIPPGLSPAGGAREWHGVMRLGETKRLDIQLVAPTAGVYYLRGTFWLKQQVGDTFKGGHRIKAELLRVSVGGASEPGRAPRRAEVVER